MRTTFKRRAGLWRLVTMALFGAAVATEAAKPPDQRDGYGRIAGIVPYDFRAPTFERVKGTLWNPEDERLFLPTIFGVGWAINFARAARLAANAKAKAEAEG